MDWWLLAFPALLGSTLLPTPPGGCPMPHPCPPCPQSLAEALLSPGSCSAPALRPGMRFELPRKPPLHGAEELEPSIPADNAVGSG